MLGADQRALQALSDERDERLAGAAQRDERHIRLEVMVARRIRNRLDDLLDGSVEQLPRRTGRRRLQPLRKRGEARVYDSCQRSDGEGCGAEKPPTRPALWDNKQGPL